MIRAGGTANIIRGDEMNVYLSENIKRLRKEREINAEDKK